MTFKLETLRLRGDTPATIVELPFYRAGEALYGQPPLPLFSVADLLARFKAGPLQFVVDYGMVAVYGMTVWALLAPLAAVVLYLALKPLLQGLARRSGAARTA